jgi:hypothetical protein
MKERCFFGQRFAKLKRLWKKLIEHIVYRLKASAQLGLPRHPRSTPARIACESENAGAGGNLRERRAGLL